MIVFKTMLKIFNKNKMFLILYTGLLIFFTAFSLNNSDSTSTFSAIKPTIVVINNDNDTKITNNLIKYIKKNSEKIKIKDSEEARDDALFYEDIHYIIYIPKNYTEDFLNHKNPTLDIKKKDNYYASLSEQI
jgi:ABC-2 type transport system permease protein